MYNRTTSAKHRECCQLVYRKSLEAGDIYLGSYNGWCAPRAFAARSAHTVEQVQRAGGDVRDRDGCGGERLQGPRLRQAAEADEGVVLLLQAVQVREQGRLGSPRLTRRRFQLRLIEHIESHPEFVQPEGRRNEILQRLQREPLLDLSISRTSFDWGIPVPGDALHVMCARPLARPPPDSPALQVRLVRRADELPDRLRPPRRRAQELLASIGSHHRCAACSLPLAARALLRRVCLPVGKDIIWFHCVIWPCMLWSAGLPLPKTVFGHGFVTAADGQKMSKSIGNVVDPNDVLSRVSADTFRCVAPKHTIIALTYPRPAGTT